MSLAEDTPGRSTPDVHATSIKPKFPWLWLFVAALFTVGLWRMFFPGAKHTAPDAGKLEPVPVSLVAVTTQDFPIYLDGIGTVQAYNSVQVNARAAGQIQEIRFREGEEVKQGEVLALIDPRTYQAQYDQAVSKQHQDEAQLQSAQVLLARDQQLLTKSVLDKGSYDTQKYLVAQLQATVQADAANVELQKAQLDYTQVTAPIAGRAGVRMLDVGNQVTAGGGGTNGASTIVVINQIQPIYVSFTLPQQEIAQIREPLLAHKNLQVTALDRNNQTVLGQGVLSVIDNQIDTATATIRLKAEFTNSDYKLWPGQFVNVRLLVGDRPNSVVVPSEAVQLGPDGAYVYVVDNKQAVIRHVVTGPSEGGMTLVESGLKSGEMVVSDGQYRLQPDAPVRVIAPPSSETFEKHPVKGS